MTLMGKEPRYFEIFSKDEYEWVKYLYMELKQKESEDWARHLLSFLKSQIEKGISRLSCKDYRQMYIKKIPEQDKTKDRQFKASLLSN